MSDESTQSYKIDHTINKSVHINGLDFPDRNDYEQYLLAKGYVDSLDELYANDDLVIKMQRHWQAQGQNGCVYGQVAASKAEEYGWKANVFNKTIDEIEQDPEILERLNTLFKASIEAPECEAISFLFPQVVNIQDVVRLTRFMMKIDSWSCDVGVYEDKAIIGLRSQLPNGVTSWIVGFGPFQFFTNTRKAPVTEIVARVKPKPDEMFHRLSHKEGIAHLGDIPTGLDDVVMERLWNATAIRVKQILQETPRITSAAKVTYVVPLDLWQQSE
jgi:hypothetical protein